MRYVLPALYEEERGIVSSIFYTSLVLFFAGCTFAYFILIPNTFAILYSFAGPLSVTPFFSLDSFIWTVFNLTILTGVAFLMPIMMFILSAIGIVSATFWRVHWRGAVVAIVVFAAVVTPDGTGVTMVILSIPLLLLYGLGILLSSRRGRG
jgi:sec-independent protein translocase protein TatC